MATTTPSHVASLAGLLDRLGNVPLDRIRVHPAPGTATEDDVIAGCEDRLCELVDGVLIDKPAGFHESLLATLIIRLIGRFLDEHDLGHVLGADTMLPFHQRVVRVYTDPTTVRTLNEDDVLEGGDVLPGFTLRLRHLFDRAGSRPSV